MKDKIKHYIKEIITFIIVMTLFANAISYYKSRDLNAKPLSLNTVTLLDNTHFSVVNNKPILIHFWATWCPTCKLEAQNIQYISEHYNVLTIAVNSGSNEEIKKYLLANDLNYKVVNDSHSVYASEFNIAAYPTTFIYDKDKNMVFSDVGYTSTLGLFFRMWWASL